jgi:8-oxo-dGTP diphosphatase
MKLERVPLGHTPRMHGLLIFTNFKGNDWYVFVFTVYKFEGQLSQDTPEGKLEWIPDDEILSLPLWDSDHIFLPWLNGERFFSAKFRYDREKFVNHEVTFY